MHKFSTSMVIANVSRTPRTTAQVVLAYTLCVLSNLSYASEHGCTVLMCLSNPAGPTAVAECIAPIQKLWRDLAKGRAFPNCDEADGADGKKSFVRQVRTPYAACPSGLRPLEEGLSAVQATSVSPEVWAVSDSSTAYTGIGSGDALASFAGRALPPKVCVGVAACNRNHSGLQSAHFWAQIICE